jgi:hypothetical protein
MSSRVNESGQKATSEIAARQLEKLTDEHLYRLAKELVEKDRIRRDFEAEWYDRYSTNVCSFRWPDFYLSKSSS